MRDKLGRFIKGCKFPKGFYSNPPSYWLGKKRSKKDREKISKAHKGKHLSEETKRKMSKRMKNNSYAFKTGRTKDTAGYILILKPQHPFCHSDGYVFEHRLVMEKHLERYLKLKEEVHHSNEIKGDNRIENLKLFASRSKHQIEEWKIRNSKV